jgi:hypothetical protein
LHAPALHEQPESPYPSQKKGDFHHRDHCRKKCRKEYKDCMKKAGLLTEFSAMDAALEWMKKHGKEILGTLVVIGGITYLHTPTGETDRAALG